MKTFAYDEVTKHQCSDECCLLVSRIQECKGKLSALRESNAALLNKLKKKAFFDNVNASLRIEGFYLEEERIKQLIDGDAPENDREEQVCGYAQALRHLEANYETVSVSAATIVSLHAMLFNGANAGRRSRYRKRDYAEVVTTQGMQRVKVSPITAFETPLYLGAACDNLSGALDRPGCSGLLTIPYFSIDFLCIRPFDEGTGRLMRLFAHFMMLRCDIDIAQYMSIDKLCEESGMDYYNALNECAPNWERNANTYDPYVKYWLNMIYQAYQKLFERLANTAETAGAGKTDRIRAFCLAQDSPFAKRDVVDAFPDASVSTIENALHNLIGEGLLQKLGNGRSTKYKAL